MKTMSNWAGAVGILALASGVLMNVPGAIADSPVVLENPVLVVDPVSNMATNVLYLQNTSNVPLNVRLSASDFTNTATGKPLGAVVSFGNAGADNWVPVLETNQLATNGTWAVRVRATNVWEAGESKAMLSVNGVPSAALAAAHWRAPFGVSLAGAVAPTNDLSFDGGRPISLVLSNADPMTYEVEWELSVGGIAVTNGQVSLLPSSQATAGWVSKKQIFRGLPFSIKDRSQDAQLTLKWPLPRPGGVSPREKVMAVRLRSAGSVLAQYALIILCLLAGVVGSWALHITLPNLRRRADLGTQLDRLAERTRNLSSHIDSSLRVLLRVQRRRLLSALEDGWTWSPETSNALDEVKTNIGTLDRQLVLVERMDRVYDRLAGLAAPPVPSALQAIEASLAQASRALRATTPTPEDLQSAETLMKDTESRLARLGQADDTLASLIAQRIKTVGKQLTGQLLKGPGGEDACKRLPSLLGGLVATQAAGAQAPFDATLEDPKNITPDQYALLDVRSRKLELVVQYLQALAGLGEETRNSPALQECVKRLMGRLELQGYNALRQADRLVCELQECIYPEGIVAELKPAEPPKPPTPGTTDDLGQRQKRTSGGALPAVLAPQPSVSPREPQPDPSAAEPGATIELDQPVAYPNAPALHRLVFRKTEMNDAVARNEFTYEWSFARQYAGPGRLRRIWQFLAGTGDEKRKGTLVDQYLEPGQSWSLWHFYPQAGNQEIKLTIRLAEGKPVAVLTKTIEVKALPKSHWLKERTVVEVVQTAVALLAPMLALVSGAREKLLQQDLFMAVVAVFLMGFTADAIKNLLVQGATPSSGKPTP